MSELYGSSAEDGDDPGPADETNEADQDRESPDSHDTERPGEDEEPLRRGEYSDMMHDQAAAEDHDRDYSDYRDDGDDQDPATPDASDRVELAEPRTRQEVAEETADASADPETGHQDDQAADADLDARIAEQDKLPEPCTRQEVAEQTRSGTDPLTDVTSQEDGTAERADAKVALAEAGQRAEPGQQPDEQEDHQATDQEGHREPRPLLSVVEATPDDRTLGDATPTGIGRKPTGDQLRNMESDTASRLDRLRNQIWEDADDTTDLIEKDGNLLGQLLERPPASSHSEVPTGHPVISPPSEHALEGGQVALAGFVAGMVAFEVFRRIKNKVETWRRDSR